MIHREHHTLAIISQISKDYNMINGENFFDQPIKNDKVTYENIRKICTGSDDDYTTGCLLDYPYFKNNNKVKFDYFMLIFCPLTKGHHQELLQKFKIYKLMLQKTPIIISNKITIE